MAIDLSTTRQIVLFEIDQQTPHALHRFHRTISQAVATGKIMSSDFEQVIGSYEGRMNVAYAMSGDAYERVLGDITEAMMNQMEVYHYDLDLHELYASRWTPTGWIGRVESWAIGHHVGNEMPNAKGWTFFPSSGQYFTIIGSAFPSEDL
jgi:hypothetical protein